MKKVKTAYSVCSACGREAIRETANYCLVCGKTLAEDYQPLDVLRSSYRLQGKSFLLENAPGEEIEDLFKVNKNSVSETAWACFVYSLVPYLGILFIPLTLIIGIAGVFVAARKPALGGRNLALASFGLSFPVLGIQLALWYLLYLIPELARRI